MVAPNAGPVIVARGRATLLVDPEYAVVTAVIRTHGKAREMVLCEMADRVRAATEALDAFGAALVRYETSPPSVAPHDWTRQQDDGAGLCIATVTLTITVADFTILGDLVTGLAAVELTELHEPCWGVHPDSEVRRRAIRAAAADALMRGQEYAQAMGCRVTGLMGLTDDGLTTTATGRSVRGLATAWTLAEEMFLDDMASPPFSMTPRRQRVRARVTARFAVTPPDGL